jgi:hypothetical protein
MSPPNGRIGKLDFPPADERRALLGDSDRGTPSPGPSDTSHSGSFLEHVVEGIQERDRAKMKSEVVRYGAFAWAILSWYVPLPSIRVQTTGLNTLYTVYAAAR